MKPEEILYELFEMEHIESQNEMRALMVLMGYRKDTFMEELGHSDKMYLIDGLRYLPAGYELLKKLSADPSPDIREAVALLLSYGKYIGKYDELRKIIMKFDDNYDLTKKSIAASTCDLDLLGKLVYSKNKELQEAAAHRMYELNFEEKTNEA